MIRGIKFASLPTRDQDRALRFWTEKMGFVVATDQPFDEKQRWIELRIPKSEGRVVLFTPDGHENRIGGFAPIVFWTDPARTNSELFANLTSTAFALDLLVVVLVALIWITREARLLGIPRVWAFWVLTLLFGLGGTLPLFLYVRERRLGARVGPV